jgi:hypothetical protein
MRGARTVVVVVVVVLVLARIRVAALRGAFAERCAPRLGFAAG